MKVWGLGHQKEWRAKKFPSPILAHVIGRPSRWLLAQPFRWRLVQMAARPAVQDRICPQSSRGFLSLLLVRIGGLGDRRQCIQCSDSHRKRVGLSFRGDSANRLVLYNRIPSFVSRGTCRARFYCEIRTNRNAMAFTSSS